MDFLDMYTIAERDIELVNPTSPEKILLVGKMLGLAPGMKVIDFGAGYAEPLILWAKEFGITGVGIEFREACCKRARKKISGQGLEGSLQMIHKDASKYDFRKGAYDAAVCIGASFIWNGFGPTVRKLKEAVRPGGKMAVGEPYWNRTEVAAGNPRSLPDRDRGEQGYDAKCAATRAGAGRVRRRSQGGAGSRAPEERGTGVCQ